MERSASSPRRWWRWILGNLALATCSVLFACGLAEVAIRIVAPQQLVSLRPDIWQPVDSVGWRFSPNVRTTYSTGEQTVHIVTDRDGFRIARNGRPVAPTRILLIGDSFMAAVQSEFEESFAGLLEQRLPRALSRPVAVWNTGQVAWDPPQYYLEERSTLNRLPFDAVIVSIYLGNDIVDRWTKRFPPRQPEVVHYLRVPTNLKKAELIDAVLYPINDYLKVHSHLFILLKTRLHLLLVSRGLSADYFPPEFLKRDAASPRWHVTTEICKAMGDVAAQHHLPIVFLLVPTSYQVDPAVFNEYVRGFKIDSTAVDLDQPTRLMRDSLRARGLYVVDVLAGFRAAEREGPSLYGKVDKHLSPRGHAVLEQLAEPSVLNLFGPRGRPRS